MSSLWITRLPRKDRRPNRRYRRTSDLRLPSMLQGAPGISGCAAGSAMPFHEQPVDNAIATEGSPPQSPISAHFLASATQEYWRLMGIALLDGRALDQRDEKEPGKTCVIDKALRSE